MGCPGDVLGFLFFSLSIPHRQECWGYIGVMRKMGSQDVFIECLGQGYRGALGGQPEGRYVSGEHVCMGWFKGCQGVECVWKQVCMGVSL